MTSKFKVIDMFCGCGGMGLGFKRAGFEIVSAWDIDKYAIQSYRANVDQNGIEADIREMTFNDLNLSDVWTFGFPCQDLSLGGKQAGLSGDRSGLFFEVMRLLKEARIHSPENLPKVIVAENVKGLRKYLPSLEEEYKRHGYLMYVVLYNSKYWNLPQNRERYFVVGVREDIASIPLRFPLEDKTNVPKLNTILDSQVDDKYFIEPEKSNRMVDVAIAHLLLKKGIKAISFDAIQQLFTDRDGAAYVCNARYFKGPSYQDIIKSRNTQVLVECDLEPHGVRFRMLTPTEYGRLQGFPMDSWKQVVSNMQAYKQFGNAVSVNVAEVIASTVLSFLEAVSEVAQ
ncbi:DNA (cytosine-5-)-methyltransferase [Paenibacillus sp. LBL]|uniref:DNA cytosine methyltransferase n=1 Tax=Paenibacillus sp. LBL TaxID=2940563 RepID=UPI00247472E6|nr:DNA (cytosine-5-)-methyltransferase [Paenibacillus sp. LBL]